MPKISALTSLAQASVDTAADVLPIVDATAPATTKKVTVQAMVNAGLAAAAPQGGIFALTGALTVSGQASFTDGSAAAPSVKIGDEQNGFYSDAAGSLSVATSGGRVVRFGTVGGTRNYLWLDANNTPLITAVAGATNADIGLVSAGTGAILLATNGSIATTQVRVSHVASAVNYLNLTGSATGNYVGFAAAGSDTNIGITYTAKGAGTHDYYVRNGVNFRVSASTDNAINYFTVTGQATGLGPLMLAGGSDTNVTARYRTQGTGSHQFETGSSGNIGLLVAHTASAVNYIQATGAATGNAPNFAVGGSDANVYFNYYTKGNGAHQFITGGGLQAVVGDAVSAVNYWMLTGAATGDRPAFRVYGSDTNIGVYLATKGTGSWRFATGGGDQFRIINVDSAVNYWSAYGGPTGNTPILYADGSDTNVSAGYSLKGAGSHVFYTGSTSVVQLVIAHVASTVNWPVISGSATGNAVTISTNGSDTNRSISLTAAGTGLVQITNDSLRIVTSKTPASAAATGTQGQIAWDASYIYVCTANNTWKRAALATW